LYISCKKYKFQYFFFTKTFRVFPYDVCYVSAKHTADYLEGEGEGEILTYEEQNKCAFMNKIYMHSELNLCIHFYTHATVQLTLNSIFSKHKTTDIIRVSFSCILFEYILFVLNNEEKR
jgi:hypothetical protein